VAAHWDSAAGVDGTDSTFTEAITLTMVAL
jgi:hypothetical protein